MRTRTIQKKIKAGFLDNVSKILSPEIAEELGLENLTAMKTKDTDSLNNELDSFWDPLESQALTVKDSKRFKAWIIGLIVALSTLLLLLFFVLILPTKNYFNPNRKTSVIVNGLNIEEQPVKNLKIENLNIENKTEVKTSSAPDSPLLKSESLVEYVIISGDTLEKIAMKFYGKSNYEAIDKIRAANSIGNARSLRIGQKLIIPF